MAWYRCMGDNSTGLSTLVAKPYNVVNGNYSTNNNVITYNITPASGYEGMSIQLVNLEANKEYLITFDILLIGILPSNNYSWKMGIMDGTLMTYVGNYGEKTLYNDEVSLPRTNGDKKTFSFYVKPQSSTTTLYLCTSAATNNATLIIDNFKYVDKNDKKNEKIVYIGDMIPRMTSDTEPSGVASASYVYGSRHAYAGFHTYEYVGVWHDDEFWYNNSGTGQEWLQYQFQGLVSIGAVRLSCGVSGTGVLKIQSSLDGTNFTDIQLVNVATADKMFEVNFGEYIPMRYLRILYLSTASGYIQSVRAIGYAGADEYIEPATENVLFKDGAFYNQDIIKLGVYNGTIDSSGSLLFSGFRAGILVEETNFPDDVGFWAICFTVRARSASESVQCGSCLPNLVASDIVGIISAGTNRITYHNEELATGNKYCYELFPAGSIGNSVFFGDSTPVEGNEQDYYIDEITFITSVGTAKIYS